MKFRVFVLIAGLSISAIYAAYAQKTGTAEAEGYIKESERQWAESVVTGDTAIVERIVADDFVGVDPDGNFFDKAKELSDTRESPKDFVSNHLDEVKVRLYGDAAVAQGIESWVRRSGAPLRGRWVWTDTWIKRNGKWQVVASEDLIPPEPAK